MFASLVLASVAAAPFLELRGREVMAGQIALGVPENVVVARIPRNQTTIMLTEAARRELLAKRFPTRALVLRHRGTIQLIAQSPKPAAPMNCLRTTRTLTEGEVVSRAEVEIIRCDPQMPRAALRLDAGKGILVAPGPIAAHTSLGPLRLPAAPPVPAGTAMRFRTSQGPVRVDRDVITLQPGRRGSSVFARTRDGQVLSAPLDDSAGGTTP